MAPIQRFAQVVGVAYLVVGVSGFVPPLLTGGPGAAPGGLFTGFLLGLFAVNWFHSLAHLALGIAGLTVYRSFQASRIYALLLGIIYGALFLLGVLSTGISTLGGPLPLNSWDNALHLLTSLAALLAYFTARLPEAEQGAAEPRS